MGDVEKEIYNDESHAEELFSAYWNLNSEVRLSTIVVVKCRDFQKRKPTLSNGHRSPIWQLIFLVFSTWRLQASDTCPGLLRLQGFQYRDSIKYRIRKFRFILDSRACTVDLTAIVNIFFLAR